MGSILHHAIIVTSWCEADIKAAAAAAQQIFGFTPPIQGPSMNDYHTFLIPPDGSKEGWEDSDKGDHNREAFKQWLVNKRYEDKSSPYSWVEVQYGDSNNYDTHICDDSDACRRSNDRP